jgi:ABC-type amino acid transport system permease subunit
MWNSLHGALFSSPYWDQGKWILLASWILSIISSYFAGKKADLHQPKL